MKNNAPFEAILSERAQFQTLTLVVWVFWLALVITATIRWQHSHQFQPTSGFLIIVHLLPWLVGLIERRNLIERRMATHQEPQPERTQQTDHEACLRSIIRLLWGAYSALLIVESMVAWH
jgi:hypothetical protein